MTLLQLVQILTVIGVIVGFLRWILSFYFKKSTELENLKAEHRSAAQKSITEDITGLKSAVAVFRQELNGFKLELTEHAGRLRENARMFEIFQKQWERTAQHLEERYNALDGAEVVKVAENTFIFKSRKN